MATKTSLLGLTKPAYTEAADIAVLNTNFDLIDKAVGNGKFVQNLLDNSWFVNPINQRGIASGATVGSYQHCIDRWQNCSGTEGTLTFNNNGIVFRFNLCQFLNPDTIKAGMAVTAAAKWADGTIQVAKGTITKNSGWTWFHSETNNGRMIGVVDQNGTNYVRIDNDNGDTLVWAALYEGAYDADTLPAYVNKGYAAELLECQRYYIKIATQPVSGWCYNWGRATMFVSLPVTMRTAPAVNLTSTSSNFYIGSTSYACELSSGTAVSNGIDVYFSHSHSVTGQCVMPEFAAEFIADL